jgi:hypothetical protein
MTLRIILVLLFSALSACASNPPQKAQWPTDIPSHDYFVSAYESDRDNIKNQDLDSYMLWVLRFYKGWELYHNGWTQVTEDSLIGVTDPLKAQEIKTKMDKIGVGIASEWAKSKSDRRIYTRHVVVWGNALVESIKRGEELTLINRVLSDVNGLVAKEISVDEINAERYYAKEKGDDVFS